MPFLVVALSTPFALTDRAVAATVSPVPYLEVSGWIETTNRGRTTRIEIDFAAYSNGPGDKSESDDDPFYYLDTGSGGVRSIRYRFDVTTNIVNPDDDVSATVYAYREITWPSDDDYLATTLFSTDDALGLTTRTHTGSEQFGQGLPGWYEEVRFWFLAEIEAGAVTSGAPPDGFEERNSITLTSFVTPVPAPPAAVALVSALGVLGAASVRRRRRS